MIVRLEELLVPDDEKQIDLRRCSRRQAVTWLISIAPTGWLYAVAEIKQARQKTEDLVHFEWSVYGAVTDVLRTYLDYGNRCLSYQDREFIENLCALVLEFRIGDAVSAVYGLSRSEIADFVLMRVGDPRAFRERWRVYWEGDDVALWMRGWEGIMRAEPRSIFKEFGCALRRANTNNFRIDDALDLLRHLFPEYLVREERERILESTDPMGDDARVVAMLDAV